MRCYGGSQTNQGEVLDDSCHVTFVLRILRSKGHIITIASFFGHKLR